MARQDSVIPVMQDQFYSFSEGYHRRTEIFVYKFLYGIPGATGQPDLHIENSPADAIENNPCAVACTCFYLVPAK